MSAKNFEFGFPTKEPVSYDEAVMYCFFYNQPDSKGWRMMNMNEVIEYIHQYSSFDRPVWFDDPYHMDDSRWFAQPVRDV